MNRLALGGLILLVAGSYACGEGDDDDDNDNDNSIVAHIAARPFSMMTGFPRPTYTSCTNCVQFLSSVYEDNGDGSFHVDFAVYEQDKTSLAVTPYCTYELTQTFADIPNFSNEDRVSYQFRVTRADASCFVEVDSTTNGVFAHATGVEPYILATWSTDDGTPVDASGRNIFGAVPQDQATFTSAYYECPAGSTDYCLPLCLEPATGETSTCPITASP